MTAEAPDRGVAAPPVAVRAESLRVVRGRAVVLDEVDLVVEPGTVTSLIGPNGSGKSTLLDAMVGLVEVAGGTLEVFGQPPAASRRRVAYVLQETVVGEQLPISVRATVRMGRAAVRGSFGRMGAQDHRIVEEVMERLEVADLARRSLRELSGGQRQRVLVAQGLAQQADLLLLDEPVNGLDLVSRGRILEVIDEERRAGRAVVVTTHDLDDARRADRAVLLAGRVVAQGPPSEVLVPDVLRAAYGGRLLTIDGGDVYLDDHHHHG